jgi:hypothetical protein
MKMAMLEDVLARVTKPLKMKQGLPAETLVNTGADERT